MVRFLLLLHSTAVLLVEPVDHANEDGTAHNREDDRQDNRG